MTEPAHVCTSGAARTGRPSVLVAHPSPDLYGSDRQLLESITAMTAAGYVVTVALPIDGPLRPLLEERGAEVRVCAFPVLRKALLRPAGLVSLGVATLRALRWMRRLLREQDYGLVYVNTVTVPVWLVAARLSRTRSLCHVHEAEESLPRVARVLLALPLLLADAVVANSAVTRRVLVEAVPRLARRITVVHNGVPDVGCPAPLRERRPTDPLRLALVSRLSPRKGISTALEAVAELRAQGRPVHLDVCGTAFPGYEWHEQELVDRASSDDLAGAVRFHGYVDPTRPVLESADVVLVPSHGESFGNAAVEGMLAGRPVVASDVQGLAEVLDDERTGVLVPVGDSRALAAAVAALADDPARAASLGAAARRVALHRFSTAEYRRRLLAALEAAAGGVRPAAASPRSRRTVPRP